MTRDTPAQQRGGTRQVEPGGTPEGGIEHELIAPQVSPSGYVPPRRVRVVALALIVHPDRAAIFVNEFADRHGQVFHRPCGGGVEFGEPAASALAREFDEEFGTRIEVAQQVAVVENLFTFNGQPGHEYLILFRARFTDEAFLRDRAFPVLDTETDIGVWRPLTGPPDVPLYPEGLEDLLHDR